MNYEHLTNLRKTHPAWRLLCADHAPLIVGFLFHNFVRTNVRTVGEQDLTSLLDDYLYHLRQSLGEDALPLPARDYLRNWAEDTQGWLRRYYPAQTDEPHYDLTPAAEQAIQWLQGLEQRQFVGAESRLKLVFDLLRQITAGIETDPEVRIRELERRRTAIDDEIDRIRQGNWVLLDPTQVRERFLQAVETARALLSDFRQVEQNFRDLDRQIRERIATSEGAKGEILEEVFGERENIVDSDQGRSFRAFWDLLMSPAMQDELTQLLDRLFELEPIVELDPDPRLKRIHYDWLEAGEVTQRTVARLSEQLRRFLDDQALFENRRIMTIIHELEQAALAVRDTPPGDTVTELDEASPRVSLPMDRPMFTPPFQPYITQQTLDVGDADISADILFDQFVVDKDRLRARIRRALQTRNQISLRELLREQPIEQGLAELVAWLSLATGEEIGVIDEDRQQTVEWIDDAGTVRKATLPTVIFVQPGRREEEWTTSAQ